MDLADNGDLSSLLNQNRQKHEYVPEKQIWHYFIQLTRGLQTLHDLKIVHRDIKCANIFLTKDGVLKLGDLNVSKIAKLGML